MSPSRSESGRPAWRATLARLAQRARHAVRSGVVADALFVGPTDEAAARTDPLTASLDGFAHWCAAHPGSRCELGLSARLVHTCVAPPEAGALAPEDLRDYAQRQFQHYFGTVEAGYVVAASTVAEAPLACGAPATVVQALQAIAAEQGVRIARLAPWWAAGVAAALRQAPADAACTVVALEPQAFTVLQAAGGRVQRIWTEVLPPGAGDWRARLREHLSAGQPVWLVSEPAAAAVLRGRAPAQSLSI